MPEDLPVVSRREQDRSVAFKTFSIHGRDVMLIPAVQARKAELPFSCLVEGKGTVAGVLYYFPFENERENVPMEPIHNPLLDPAGGMGLTQHPAGTQLALTQARTSPEPEGKLSCHIWFSSSPFCPN